MGILNSLLQSFFGGNKSDRDIKEITPLVEAIHSEYNQIVGLSNDEIRARSSQLKEKIRAGYAADEDEIKKLREVAENPATEIHEKERLYNQIDKIEKKIREKVEEALADALPLAFAIVKETARRFKENPETVVNANDHDRYLATIRDFVRI